MKVFFSPYSLEPKNRANNQSDLKTKHGIFLRSESEFIGYADYFPHGEFGDQSISEFMSSFPDRSNHYHQKILHRLKQPLNISESASFKNHQLYHPGDQVESNIIKYKLFGLEDTNFSALAQRGITLRLDANGIFNRLGFLAFLKGLSPKALESIEYIEDPSKDLNWDNDLVKLAEDFIQGSPTDFIVYKPTRTLFPETNKRIIFSSYMSSWLGLWQDYLELIAKGDLTLTHGLLTPGIYSNMETIFNGNYHEGFRPDLVKIRTLLNDFELIKWTYLCQI